MGRDTGMSRLYREARALARKSKYPEALRLYSRALKKCEHPEEELTCLLALGDTSRMTGDFTSSVTYYESAMDTAGQLRETEVLNDAQVGLGLAHRGLGNWKDALSLLRKAGRYYAKADDKVGVAFTRWAEAGALRIKGDIPQAYAAFKEAHKLFKSLGDMNAVGYSLCGMGGTARVLGRPAKSLEHYTEANGLFRELKDTFGTAYSHCGMGNALRMKGELDPAREHFVRASQLYNRMGDRVSYAYTLWSLAKTHMEGGNFVLAYKYVKEARTLFKKTRDPRGMIYVKLAIAEINALKGATARARSLVQEAITEAKAWGFQVELAHALVMLSVLAGSPDNSAYKKLGLSLSYKSVPLNIP